MKYVCTEDAKTPLTKHEHMYSKSSSFNLVIACRQKFGFQIFVSKKENKSIQAWKLLSSKKTTIWKIQQYNFWFKESKLIVDIYCSSLSIFIWWVVPFKSCIVQMHHSTPKSSKDLLIDLSSTVNSSVVSGQHINSQQETWQQFRNVRSRLKIPNMQFDSMTYKDPMTFLSSISFRKKKKLLVNL